VNDGAPRGTVLFFLFFLFFWLFFFFFRSFIAAPSARPGMIAQGLHSLDQHHWPTPQWQPATITEGIEKGTLALGRLVPDLQEIQNL
jgi:hypothetical protein